MPRRWGRVLERDGDHLVVNVVPLALVGGKFALAPPRIDSGVAGSAGFIGNVAAGDVVSIHWD